MKTFLLSIWLLANLLATGAGHAQMILPSSGGEKQLNALVDQAAVIIEGKAERGYYSFWNAAHTAIYTATPVTVFKVFRAVSRLMYVATSTPKLCLGLAQSSPRHRPTI